MTFCDTKTRAIAFTEFKKRNKNENVKPNNAIYEKSQKKKNFGI